MGYQIDRRLLRLTGDLLAAGSGVFHAADVRRLCVGALEDDTLVPAEMAAILVASMAVGPFADADARGLFAEAANAARQDDPDLEPWIASSISAALLRRGAILIAGRGRQYPVPRSDVVDLIGAAYLGGPGPARAITADEAIALLAIRELFDGRLTADARQLFDEFCATAREDGYSLGTGAPAPGGTAPPSGPAARQCGACAGSGAVTCSACGGHGYHVRSGTRTRADGSTEYYQEHVPCSCSGGRVRCGRCAGSGRI